MDLWKIFSVSQMFCCYSGGSKLGFEFHIFLILSQVIQSTLYKLKLDMSKNIKMIITFYVSFQHR